MLTSKRLDRFLDLVVGMTTGQRWRKRFYRDEESSPECVETAAFPEGRGAIPNPIWEQKIHFEIFLFAPQYQKFIFTLAWLYFGRQKF